MVQQHAGRLARRPKTLVFAGLPCTDQFGDAGDNHVISV